MTSLCLSYVTAFATTKDSDFFPNLTVSDNGKCQTGKEVADLFISDLIVLFSQTMSVTDAKKLKKLLFIFQTHSSLVSILLIAHGFVIIPIHTLFVCRELNEQHEVK